MPQQPQQLPQQPQMPQQPQAQMPQQPQAQMPQQPQAQMPQGQPGPLPNLTGQVPQAAPGFAAAPQSAPAMGQPPQSAPAMGQNPQPAPGMGQPPQSAPAGGPAPQGQPGQPQPTGPNMAQPGMQAAGYGPAPGKSADSLVESPPLSGKMKRKFRGSWWLFFFLLLLSFNISPFPALIYFFWKRKKLPIEEIQKEKDDSKAAKSRNKERQLARKRGEATPINLTEASKEELYDMVYRTRKIVEIPLALVIVASIVTYLLLSLGTNGAIGIAMVVIVGVALVTWWIAGHIAVFFFPRIFRIFNRLGEDGRHYWVYLLNLSHALKPKKFEHRFLKAVNRSFPAVLFVFWIITSIVSSVVDNGNELGELIRSNQIDSDTAELRSSLEAIIWAVALAPILTAFLPILFIYQDCALVRVDTFDRKMVSFGSSIGTAFKAVAGLGALVSIVRFTWELRDPQFIGVLMIIAVVLAFPIFMVTLIYGAIHPKFVEKIDKMLLNANLSTYRINVTQGGRLMIDKLEPRSNLQPQVVGGPSESAGGGVISTN